MEMKRMLLAMLLGVALVPAQEGTSPRALDRIMIVRAEGANFQETVKGLERELGPEFEIEERVMGAGIPIDAAAQLSSAIAQSRPRALVLMDNEAIALYGAVQGQWKDSVPFPPSISMMAIRVDKAIGKMRRAAGIFYEVPGVTILVNLRSLVEGPVRKVGVIVRPSMMDLVRENAKWCKSENIELVPFEVAENRLDVARAVRTGVRRLRDRDKVDALWILNDNYFLSREIIGEGWLPALERFHKPVVVGVENFVSRGSRFGTFAILPDHYGLGVQAAGKILRLRDDGWVMEGPPGVEQSLAVYKILNLVQARKSARIRESALVEVDKILK